jgi:hypothetical protein
MNKTSGEEAVTNYYRIQIFAELPCHCYMLLCSLPPAVGFRHQSHGEATIEKVKGLGIS